MKMLLDYFPDAQYNLDEGEMFSIIAKGKIYPYEMTLSSKVPDDICCRVFIDGEEYRFGHL